MIDTVDISMLAHIYTLPIVEAGAALGAWSPRANNGPRHLESNVRPEPQKHGQIPRVSNVEDMPRPAKDC